MSSNLRKENIAEEKEKLAEIMLLKMRVAV
jgi:hypothetical protein